MDDVASYTGITAVTESGRTCQAWKESSPHAHTRGHSGSYASYWTNLGETADQSSNYCRDPDGEGQLWCYTTDSEKRWEHCAVPECPEEIVEPEPEPDCMIALASYT